MSYRSETIEDFHIARIEALERRVKELEGLLAFTPVEVSTQAKANQFIQNYLTND
jgi:hypothetical protein